ncbi:MAG: CDP-diacylglycerol--glycerol-3-phosphate 3-phosphatidyltransferase [Bradymonadales bacterium]|nr:MAG: CDP-diacylglycerol--glycerol-3-phosphate 3-phosphatidyltransferase [Bradymonadales bacterium]
MKRQKDSIHQSDFYLLPNLITVSRVIAVPLIILLLYWDFNIGATITFVAVAISDGVDGYIARRYQSESRLGVLLDPLADKLIIVCTMIMLLWLGRLDVAGDERLLSLLGPVMVIVTVGREIAVTGLRGIASSVGLVVPADRGGKIKTAIQFVAISLLLLNWEQVLIWGQILLGISVLAALWSGFRYFVHFVKNLPA